LRRVSCLSSRVKTKILVSELKESDAAVLGASALGWEARYRYEAPHLEKIEDETVEKK